MKINAFRLALLGASAITVASLSSAPAFAQSTQAAAEPTNVGEIVVQARRRAESLVDVPLAITVVTDAKLQQLDIKSTTDLANYTPGLTFNNFTAGDARNDRSADRPIIMRGLNLGIGASQGASMFLNGAAVVSNEPPTGMDIGSVEVLRGPQSVYFGRSTLTGAVSYRTKAIGDEISGQVQVRVAAQDERGIEGSISGPLVPGILKVRLTGLTESYGGYVTNDFNGGSSKLGATSRDSVSATVIVTPTADIEFKGYANYMRDDDGPAATAFVPPSFANCQFPGALRRTICGKIPSRQNSINYANLAIPQYVSDVIFSTPLIAGAGFKKKLGQQREATNMDLVGSWQINDYLHLEEITGYHKNITMAVADGLSQAYRTGGTPGVQASGYFPDKTYMYTYSTRRKDFSQEVRLSSDPDRRLSWTLGANYIRLNQAISAYVAQINNADVGRFFKQPIVPSESNTYGIFGGVYYKVTDDLTVSAEGRHQSDKIALPTAGYEATFKSNSPRVSIAYDVGHNRNLYASYAVGNYPGGFNTSVSQYRSNAPAFAEIQTLLAVTGDSFKEEKLKMAEVGFKGNFAAGRGYFDVNAYTGTLLNQQIRSTAFIPTLGFTVSVTNNAGRAKVHGIEFQGSYNFTDDLSISGTYAWNHTKRTDYINGGGVSQFGTTNFNGKEFAQVPEFSGSAVLAYKRSINDDWNGFGNLAAVYRGKQWMDDYNASYIEGRWQVDLRAGISNDKYTVEGFVKNLLDNQGYTGGGTTGDFGQGGGNFAFFGGWAPPRQVGMRLGAKF